MRVVSTTPHPNVVKQIVCNHCGATLEYVPIDVQERQVRDYTGDSDRVRYLVCGHCSEEIISRIL